MKAKPEFFYPWGGQLLVYCLGYLLYQIINNPRSPSASLAGFMPSELWNISALQPQLVPTALIWMWSLYSILLSIGAVSLYRRSWLLLLAVPCLMLVSIVLFTGRLFSGPASDYH